MSVLENVALADVERELAQLRKGPAAEGAPDLRMSTMTHVAWVPEPWYERAISTLRGMGDRHPSRTILLVPQPNEPESRIDAELEVERFPLDSVGRRVCAEVIVLRLKGRRANAPASIVQPLLISGLPVFLRWRGEPPWSTAPFEELVELVDRLVVNSAEWDDLPFAYGKLTAVFDRAVASDLAWARTLGWRRSVAELWPGVADVRQLRVAGPLACALLLHGWLASRLGNDIELVQVEAGEDVESIALDGTEVTPPRGERPSGSDLLSDELDVHVRDAVYEQAAAQAVSSAP
jgi:Glucose-6-phosphate dehydrogenase subunit N-terminal domain/Glucose-6-phosphate dehydrogenase subunit C-terminal domain